MATLRVMTGITVERRLVAFPDGATVGDRVCTIDPSTCCDEPGSGPGGTVSVGCCADAPIPQTLYVTFSPAAGLGLECLSGSWLMAYNATDQNWYLTDAGLNGTTPLAGCGAFRGFVFRIYCQSAGANTWVAAFSMACDASLASPYVYGANATVTPTTCDPFLLEGSIIIPTLPSVGTTCTATAQSIPFVITETAP